MSQPPLPSSRRERRRQETRERILEAAHSLFRAHGYQASTVAEICERADVAYKTFFNHFPSKNEVLLEIEARSLDELLAHFSWASELEGSTRERLLALFERVAREAEAAGPMNRELLAELIHSAHTRGDESEQVRLVIEATERIVEAGIAQGDVRTDHSVETIAEAIRGNYYALVISYGNLPDYPIVARARELAAMLADSVEGRAASKPNQ